MPPSPGLFLFVFLTPNYLPTSSKWCDFPCQGFKMLVHCIQAWLPSPLFCFVLVRISITVIKHHDQKELGKGFILLTLPVHHRWKSGQEPRDSFWHSSHGGQEPCSSWLAQSAFFIEARVTSAGMTLSIVSWALLHQSQVNEMFCSLATAQSYECNYSVEALCTQMSLAYVKIWL